MQRVGFVSTVAVCLAGNLARALGSGRVGHELVFMIGRRTGEARWERYPPAVGLTVESSGRRAAAKRSGGSESREVRLPDAGCSDTPSGMALISCQVALRAVPMFLAVTWWRTRQVEGDLTWPTRGRPSDRKPGRSLLDWPADVVPLPTAREPSVASGVVQHNTLTGGRSA